MICSRVPGRLMYQPNCLLLAQVESAAQQTVALLAMSRFCVEVLMVTARSEEHTSELQSRLHLVCRLLLEKKKKSHIRHKITNPHHLDFKTITLRLHSLRISFCDIARAHTDTQHHACCLYLCTLVP